MAIICKKLGLIYIQVPATGCSVVSVLLRQSFEGCQLGRKHDTVAELLEQNLITRSQLENCLVLANIRNPFDRLGTYFQRYKGPWATESSLRVQANKLQRVIESRALSKEAQRLRIAQFDHKRARTLQRVRTFRFLGFNTWLWVTVTRWQIQAACHSSGSNVQALPNRIFPMLEGVDVTLPQETLEKSLNAVLSRLGVDEPVSLPRKNLTQGKEPYTSYYNSASRWLLQSLYGEAIREMGYQYGVSTYDARPIPLTMKGKEFIN